MKDILITNNTEIKFLDKIKDSFKHCKMCYISVSFIKKAGLSLFEKELEECLKRGAIVNFITSTYQNFTDIPSLNKFLLWQKEYKNFECHLDYKCFGDSGFHTKGYIFVYDDVTEVIIGSTNITRYAILKNIEWNVSLYRNNDVKIIGEVINEFNKLYSNTFPLTSDLVEKYKKALMYSIVKWDMDYFNDDISPVVPNVMQRTALKEIRRYRDLGTNKALVVAATGSGKTYLAALDARNFNPRKLLYVVHRDAILKGAMSTFKNVFGFNRTYGYYTGETQELNCDFIFATSIMLAKHLDEFDKNEFEYIVYDEVHHIMADTGMKIFSYFTPSFLLGLTATPERMDNKDVMGLFENNIPFELRLRDAILYDLVVPFHYYGIRDTYADYSSNDKAKVSREIAKSVNIDFIISQIIKHKKENAKLKALAFCNTVEHCQMMANGFNEMGYSAVALTGNNDLGERIKAFDDLQNDLSQLQIICAVDILNEGIDIPSVNMVLFLRPTESQTIFLQQLGRGLRKYPQKEYVTVLDFIGNNYDRSVQIAAALGTLGKASYMEKKYLADLVGSNFANLNIPGVEIFFDNLSKIEIIDYINKQNFNKVNILKADYDNFKKFMQIDTYPSHMDYIDSELAPDLIRFIKSKVYNKKNRSYYCFLKKIGEDNIPYFNDNEIELINEISDLLPIVRYDEMIILRDIVNSNEVNLDSLVDESKKVTLDTLNHALTMLIKDKVLTANNKLNISILSDDLKLYLNDLINYAITKYENDFGEFEGSFKLMGNYYKEQIFRILLEDSLLYQLGTKTYDNGVTYLFVGLKKDKSKEEKLNYKDKFLSSKVFQWESVNGTTTSNTSGKRLINTKIVHLFVRKMDEQDGITLPFTYFGTGKFTNMRETKNGESSTLTFDVLLDNKVDKEYYLDFEIPDEE